MSTEDQVRLTDGVAWVSEQSDLDPSVEITQDPGGRRYDDASLGEVADEAESLGPPQLRRGRPPLGATSQGRSPRLSTRVPHEVDDAVRAAATREGVSPAQWLREAIEQRLVRGWACAVDRQPARPPPSASFPGWCLLCWWSTEA